MKKNNPNLSGQLGFESLLADADTGNRARKIERETAHLPGTIEKGVAFYADLLERHHAAMLAADAAEAMRLRAEAHLLALKLNGGDAGILSHDGAPGYVLAGRTAAAPGAVPRWGQTGDFTVMAGNMKLRIALDGIFGICGQFCLWPGFAAHAVEYDRPFLSETGFRSFLGVHAELRPRLAPDEFVEGIIRAYVARECKGKLLAIEPRYRENRAA